MHAGQVRGKPDAMARMPWLFGGNNRMGSSLLLSSSNVATTTTIKFALGSFFDVIILLVVLIVQVVFFLVVFFIFDTQAVLFLVVLFVLYGVFLARAWDAVSDPMAGYLSDRTATPLGRRRSWLAASAMAELLACFMTSWRVSSLTRSNS